jgi:NADP-dependent 3-hydroxy acid dehydrogenase YdfG
VFFFKNKRFHGKEGLIYATANEGGVKPGQALRSGNRDIHQVFGVDFVTAPETLDHTMENTRSRNQPFRLTSRDSAPSAHGRPEELPPQLTITFHQMNEMKRKLTGKVALITGASAGIGQACARALAEEGANLVLTARRRDRLDALAKESAASGVETAIVTGDAREEETARQSCAAAKDKWGRLDILISNTGIGNYKNLVDTSAEEYDEMMDTNVRSTFLFARHAVPLMLAQKSGTILMISSMAGIYGFGGEAVYCMTKFAQVGFAQALDKELRQSGIKVGAICPGGVKTEFALGKGRTEQGVAQSEMLDAEDVASAVLLACTQSPKSRIIEIQMRTMAEPLA